MGHVLVVGSSAAGEQSASRGLAMDFARSWCNARAGAEIVERTLLPETTPHLGADLLTAMGTSPEQRNAAQSAALAYSDTLVDELIGADAVVIASPMYTSTISSTLKAWLEQVNRPGRTFTLPSPGNPPRGLLQGRVAVAVCTRGANFSQMFGDHEDFQAPLLRSAFKTFGLDLQIVLAEGMATGDAEQAAAQARDQLEEIARASA